jgi:hypothetical protein
MDILNAIAKVRFASARPQRVQLHKDGRTPIDMLCMEPGQKLKVPGGWWAYYVMTGTARIESNASASDLPAGQFAVTGRDEGHTVSSAGEQRLVCLAIARE